MFGWAGSVFGLMVLVNDKFFGQVADLMSTISLACCGRTVALKKKKLLTSTM
jgi:hypothetical protein